MDLKEQIAEILKRKEQQGTIKTNDIRVIETQSLEGKGKSGF